MGDLPFTSSLPWDWRWVLEIIESGGVPTNRAVIVALRGPQPVPSEIRIYLAERLENGWPKGGRTKTAWEKLEPYFNEDTRQSNLFDAAIEVDWLWNCYQVCEEISGGKSIKDAITQIENNMIASVGQNSIFERDLSSDFQAFTELFPEPFSGYAGKNLDDIIEEVSSRGSSRVTFDALRQFYLVDRYRLSR